ncbi:hypothetical protein ALC56_14237 [Trachymyrmex septentrionalis]|uniref:Uncharacterized protein n=1 Tax=Trachymyrmex septentrionalis TaxID=34720 RepID=A0A195ET71_9HYME|nr:hypothetical protein ALC56_14237 [Trachymyrmex septentrionalis]
MVLHCIRDHFNAIIFLKLGDSGRGKQQSEISHCSIVPGDEVDVNVKNIIIMWGIGYSKNSKTKAPESQNIIPLTLHLTWTLHEHAHVQRRPRETRIHHADAQRVVASRDVPPNVAGANQDTRRLEATMSGPFELD